MRNPIIRSLVLGLLTLGLPSVPATDTPAQTPAAPAPVHKADSAQDQSSKQESEAPEGGKPRPHIANGSLNPSRQIRDANERAKARPNPQHPGSAAIAPSLRSRISERTSVKPSASPPPKPISSGPDTGTRPLPNAAGVTADKAQLQQRVVRAPTPSPAPPSIGSPGSDGVPHQPPKPAVVGGAAGVSAQTGPALNGTGMKHKP
jgi:hypothetical protein